MKRCASWLLGAVLAIGVPTVGRSELLPVVPNGPTVLLTGTTSAADPTLAGTVIADTVDDFFGLNFKGTYQTRVVRRDDTGTLDFYYRINAFVDQTTEGARVLRDFRVSDYVGFTTEVSWRPDGLPAPGAGEVWRQAIRFPQPQSSSDGLNLSFADLEHGDPSNFISGDESYFAVIRTNATDFKLVTADVYLVSPPGTPFAQYLSSPFQVYAPAAVPEPSTAALTAVAFTGLVGAIRRRRGQ
ncbi:MAG: PEP-CTERM sorting domain-containing protein [Pirellulales bacterium]